MLIWPWLLLRGYNELFNYTESSGSTIILNLSRRIDLDQL